VTSSDSLVAASERPAECNLGRMLNFPIPPASLTAEIFLNDKGHVLLLMQSWLPPYFFQISCRGFNFEGFDDQLTFENWD